MADHPTVDTFEAYVMDTLCADEAEAFEKHVASCETCAATLAGEAMLEERLHHLGALGSASPSPVTSLPARRGGLAIAAALTLAAAAGLALWLGSSGSSPETVEVAQPWLIRHLPQLGLCEQRPDLCEHPERHGIVVLSAAGLQAARYEDGPPLLSWRLGDQPQPKRSTHDEHR